MASVYPSALDDFTTNLQGNTLMIGHANQHDYIGFAIEALQGELGVNPSGGYATVSARLAAIVAGSGDSVSLAPDDPDDNIIQPAADVTALRIREPAGGGTEPFLVFEDEDENQLAAFSPLGHLGIGVATPSWPLDITWDTTKMIDFAQTEASYRLTRDVVDIWLHSLGDGVFVTHLGGLTPPDTPLDGGGGQAALNVLIPYYLDDTGSGDYSGSTQNLRTGNSGLLIATQSVTDAYAIRVEHKSNSYAQFLDVQNPTGSHPVGVGGGLLITDWSAASSLKITKSTVPGAAEAIIALKGNTTVMKALRVAEVGGFERAVINTDGTSYFGTASPFASGMHVHYAPGAGVARTLALSQTEALGSGAQVEFDSESRQFAIIQGVQDAVTTPATGSLRFQVRTGDSTMTERLRLNGTGIGVFGVTPAARAAAYTPTNVSADRAYNANVTSLDELADVVGTLIADLQLYGWLQ